MSHVTCGGVAVALSLVAVVSMQAEERQVPAKAAGATSRIERALEQPVRWNFRESPLSTVASSIREQMGIHVQVNQSALDDMGIDCDLPVTVTVTDLPLASALELAFLDSGLTWTVWNEALVITTPEKAADLEMLVTRVYPVGDLVLHGPGPVGTPRWMLWSGHGGVPPPQAKALPGSDANFDRLIEMITSTISPTSWGDVGGPGSIEYYKVNDEEVLIISHTYRVQRAIERLFSDLRAIKPHATSGVTNDLPRVQQAPSGR